MTVTFVTAPNEEGNPYVDFWVRNSLFITLNFFRLRVRQEFKLSRRVVWKMEIFHLPRLLTGFIDIAFQTYS